MSSKAIKS